MKFSWPEYWSGQPFPSPGDLPNPRIEPRSPALQADSLPIELRGKPLDRYKLTYGHHTIIQGTSLNEKITNICARTNDTEQRTRNKSFCHPPLMTKLHQRQFVLNLFHFLPVTSYSHFPELLAQLHFLQSSKKHSFPTQLRPEDHHVGCSHSTLQSLCLILCPTLAQSILTAIRILK